MSKTQQRETIRSRGNNDRTEKVESFLLIFVVVKLLLVRRQFLGAVGHCEMKEKHEKLLQTDQRWEFVTDAIAKRTCLETGDAAGSQTADVNTTQETSLLESLSL